MIYSYENVLDLFKSRNRNIPSRLTFVYQNTELLADSSMHLLNLIRTKPQVKVRTGNKLISAELGYQFPLGSPVRTVINVLLAKILQNVTLMLPNPIVHPRPTWIIYNLFLTESDYYFSVTIESLIITLWHLRLLFVAFHHHHQHQLTWDRTFHLY